MKIAALITLLAAPVAAQEFTPPAGCEAYLTVQKRDCEVDHHFRCARDPAGHQQRASFNETQMTYLGTIDAETQWVISHRVPYNYTEELEPNPAEPASFSTLLETGTDAYDFETESAQVGTTRYVGSDTLTGRTVTIDGVTLEETNYQMTASDSSGAMLWQSEGTEYISREWRMFVAGQSTVTTPTNTFETDSRPMQFITAGEAGFLSLEPKFGCDILMSAAPVMQEYSDDNL